MFARTLVLSILTILSVVVACGPTHDNKKGKDLDRKTDLNKLPDGKATYAQTCSDTINLKQKGSEKDIVGWSAVVDGKEGVFELTSLNLLHAYTGDSDHRTDMVIGQLTGPLVATSTATVTCHTTVPDSADKKTVGTTLDQSPIELPNAVDTKTGQVISFAAVAFKAAKGKAGGVITITKPAKPFLAKEMDSANGPKFFTDNDQRQLYIRAEFKNGNDLLKYEATYTKRR